MGHPSIDGGHPKHVEFYVALVSCGCTLPVILSFVFFPKMWSRLFMRIIFFIAMSDFVANSFVLAGTPTDEALCTTQGVVQQYFYPASWMWTAMLSYLLYSLVVHGKIDLSPIKMHTICWGVPFVNVFLPLSTSTYGTNPDDDSFCWVSERNSSSYSQDWTTFWQILTFTVMILGTSVASMYWGICIYQKYSVDDSNCTPAVRHAMRALFMYPLIIIICWVPNAIQTNLFPRWSADGDRLITINSLSIMQGSFTAISFFYNSREARSNWVNLWLYWFPRCRPKTAKTRAGRGRAQFGDEGSSLEHSPSERLECTVSRASSERDSEFSMGGGGGTVALEEGQQQQGRGGGGGGDFDDNSDYYKQSVAFDFEEDEVFMGRATSVRHNPGHIAAAAAAAGGGSMRPPGMAFNPAAEAANARAGASLFNVTSTSTNSNNNRSNNSVNTTNSLPAVKPTPATAENPMHSNSNSSFENDTSAAVNNQQL